MRGYMVDKELMNEIVNSYMNPEKETVSKDENGRKQIVLLAKEYNMTPSKIHYIQGQHNPCR